MGRNPVSNLDPLGGDEELGPIQLMPAVLHAAIRPRHVAFIILGLQQQLVHVDLAPGHEALDKDRIGAEMLQRHDFFY